MKFKIVYFLMAVAIAMTGCTIKIEPLQPYRKPAKNKHTGKKRSKAHSHPSATPTQRNGSVVDLDWLAHYRQMESERGDYTIPKDAEIRTDERGRVFVPREVIHHYHDMLIAPRSIPPPPMP